MNVKDFKEAVRLINSFLDEIDPMRRDMSNLKMEHHDLQCSMERLVDEILSLRETCAHLEKRIVDLENGEKK
jgi:prefoldin subunit 5